MCCIKLTIPYVDVISFAGVEVLRVSQPARSLPLGTQRALVHARPQPPPASHTVALHGQVP